MLETAKPSSVGSYATVSSWSSDSTCSSTCTCQLTWDVAVTSQPRWASSGREEEMEGCSVWSLPTDPSFPTSLPFKRPPPSSPERINLVRGARTRRPSVVNQLLKESLPRSQTVPSLGGVDASAFHRYYEGTVLGHGPRSLRNPDPCRGRGGGDGRFCGGLVGGTLASCGVGLPTKLEDLLKLFARSLHLVLASMCSRKARKKDRECSSSQEQEHKLYLEEAMLERKIPEADLRQLVELPPGLGYEEWLASHTIDFFHHVNLIYGTICEFCTMVGCPDMTGPAMRQYLWFDEKGKKARIAAPQYIDYVMTFAQNTINDDNIFPTKFDSDFPGSFESIVKKIHRLLFHVLAHLYHSHFRDIVLLSLHSHLNCIFAHFILFNERFRLIDEKETEILQDLVVALKLHPQNDSSSPELFVPVSSNTAPSALTSESTAPNATSPAKCSVESGSCLSGSSQLDNVGLANACSRSHSESMSYFLPSSLGESPSMVAKGAVHTSLTATSTDVGEESSLSLSSSTRTPVLDTQP